MSTVTQSNGANGVSIYNNGKNIITDTMAITPNAAGGIVIGMRTGYNDQFVNGLIPEVIGYNQTLNDTDRRKVESYLAVKYGISIDQTSPTDYIDSSTGIFWNASTNA